MKKLKKIDLTINTDTSSVAYAPSQEQLDALAHRLMPEIMRYFADEQIQQEFVKWRNKHNTSG